MIGLRKPAVFLANLDTNGAVTAKKAAIDSWLDGGREGKTPSFPEYWNRDDVRGALIAQQGLICAWCSCALKLKSSETTVEHYRPKDYKKPDEARAVQGDPHKGYPWLAYTWENLLMVCGECNQLKGSFFPLQEEDQRVDENSRDQLSRERPLILDPLRDSVEGALKLTFSKEDDEKYPRCYAKAAKTPLFSCAEETIKRIRLNGDGRPDLITQRTMVVGDLWKNLEEGKKKEEACSQAACRYKEHAWAAREILKGHAPHLLPEPEDDLGFLLRTLGDTLSVYEGDLNHYLKKDPSPEGKQKTRENYCTET